MNNKEFKRMMKPIGKTFLKGLIAIIPITLTLYLLLWLLDAAELALGNLFKLVFPDDWYFKGLGVILGLLVVFFIGRFVESRTFGHLFYKLEDIVIQIPVVKSIYTAFRDFTSLFSGQQKGKFQKVVLVETPYYSGHQLGFITVSELEQSSYSFMGNNQVAVFLPFSYQMGGVTVMVSRDKLVETDMSVEDALRFIATAGVVGNVDPENGNR